MLRTGGPDDLPEVVRLLRAMLDELTTYGYRELVDDPVPWGAFMERAERGLAAADHHFLLAEIDGDIVGVAEARAMDSSPLRRRVRLLHIHSMYVVPEHRRAGIGQALLDAVLEWGGREGCDQVELDVLVANPARALYEKAGFRDFELKMTRDL